MNCNMNSEAFKSRLFVKSDPLIREFSWNDYSVDIFAPRRKWWSRPYEYKWIQDVISSYFDFSKDVSALDVATGNDHPGMFILKQLGFYKVIGTDLLKGSDFPNKKYLKEGMEYIQDDILKPQLVDKFDCITFISVLEHFHPDNQRSVLENLISYLKPQGCMVLTFDMPGYDYPTNLSLYKEVLSAKGFSYKEVEPEDGSTIVRSDNCENGGNLGKYHLSCYRLFAWR